MPKRESEIRMQEVTLTGRMVGDPIVRGDEVYFKVNAEDEMAPFPCISNGSTAENLAKYCRNDDEISIEGKLIWRTFKGSDPTLLVYVRYVSYGRKDRTLR